MVLKGLFSLSKEEKEYYLHPKIPWYKFVFVFNYEYDFDKNYVSLSKTNYSLFKFIDAYCGNSIVLHSPQPLSLNDLLPLTRKLKFFKVSCLKAHKSFKYDINTLNKFTKLEGMVSYGSFSRSTTDFYNSIQLKLCKDEMISHLYLPFGEKNYSQILDKTSLKHLYVGRRWRRFELKKEITDLLVEFNLYGYSQLTPRLPENSFLSL